MAGDQVRAMLAVQICDPDRPLPPAQARAMLQRYLRVVGYEARSVPAYSLGAVAARSRELTAS